MVAKKCKKKMTFMSGDGEEVRSAQKELKKELIRAKNRYKDRLESKLQQSNAREVWSGMKEITGLNSSGPAVQGSHDIANELTSTLTGLTEPTPPGDWSPGVPEQPKL